MRKKTSLLLVVLMVLSLGLLAACSSSSSNEVKYSDQDFIKSLSKGLEARWALNDKNENKEDTVQDFKDAIQAELDQVEKYKTADFEDSVLQEKAIGYINVLNESMDNVEYAFSSDQYNKWEEIYDRRTMMIKDFVDNYGLTVSTKYQSTLDELTANGKTAEENANQREAIEKLVKGLKFKKTKDEYDWKTYEVVFENTTEYNIKDLSVEINLLDKDGVIITTEYANAQNVAKGQKARLEFSTDENFEKYETVLDWFEVE